MSKVCVACGLTTDDSGNLIVDTGDSVWPYPCNQSAGGNLYCDPVTGRLHGPPGIQVSFDQESVNTTPPSPIAVPVGITTVLTTALASTAPGSCDQEVLRISEAEFQVDLSIPVGGRVRGYIGNDEMFDIPNQTSSVLSIHSPQITKTFFTMVNSGDVSGQLTFQLNQSGPGGATYSRIQHFYRLAYITSDTP